MSMHFLRDSVRAIFTLGGSVRRRGIFNGARAEFLALLPEIREVLAKGQSLKAFYAKESQSQISVIPSFANSSRRSSSGKRL